MLRNLINYKQLALSKYDTHEYFLAQGYLLTFDGTNAKFTFFDSLINAPYNLRVL